MLSPVNFVSETNKSIVSRSNLKQICFAGNSAVVSDEKADSDQKNSSAGKFAAILAATIAAAAVVVGAICFSKGAKVLEGKKDVSFMDKLKEGWKELCGKGNAAKKEVEKPKEESKPGNKPEVKPEEPKPDGQKPNETNQEKPKTEINPDVKPIDEAPIEEEKNIEVVKPIENTVIEEDVLPYNIADLVNAIKEKKLAENVNKPDKVSEEVKEVLFLNPRKFTKKSAELERKSVLPSGKEVIYAEPIRPKEVKTESISEAIENAEAAESPLVLKLSEKPVKKQEETLLLGTRKKFHQKAAELEQKSVLPSGEGVIYSEPIRPKAVQTESISEAIENAKTVESPLVLNIKERLPYAKPEIKVIKDAKDEISILDLYNERKPVETSELVDLNKDSEIMENKEESILSYFNRKNPKILEKNLKYTKRMAENPLKLTAEPKSYIPPKILTPEEMPELFNPKLYKSLDDIPGEWTKNQTIIQKNEFGEEIREIFPNSRNNGVRKVVDSLPDYDYPCRCVNYCSDGKTIKNIIEYYPQSGTKCKETSYSKRGKIKEVLEYEQYSSYPVKRTLYYKDGENIKAVFDHSFYDRSLREAQYFDKKGNREYSAFKRVIYKILNY